MPQVRRPYEARVRFTADEVALLRARARAVGRPLARYVRETSLGATPKVTREVAEAALIRELLAIGTRLDALARAAESAHLPTPIGTEVGLTGSVGGEERSGERVLDAADVRAALDAVHALVRRL